MLTRLLAAALLVPTLTLAQEAYPPQPAYPQPQAYPPTQAYPPQHVYPAQPVPPAYQPPPAPPPPSRYSRDSWYIGFGLGTGSGKVQTQGGDTFSFTDWNQARDTTNIALNFKVGGTLSPTLLLGFDVSGVRSQGTDDFGNTTAIQVTNYDAMLTWFPYQHGLFLRGGLGLSAMSLSVNTAAASGSSTYSGGNLALGGGYAFWLGEHFNLTLNLDLSAQGYGSGTNAPKSSTMWALGVGFDWY